MAHRSEPAHRVLRVAARALEAAGVRYTWHEFNAAHAFLRDEG